MDTRVFVFRIPFLPSYCYNQTFNNTDYHKGLIDDSEMGYKLVFAGNVVAIALTVVGFLQLVSWPVAGAFILASLTFTLLFEVNHSRIRATASETPQEIEHVTKGPTKKLLVPSVVLQETQQKQQPPKPTTVKATPSKPAPSRITAPKLSQQRDDPREPGTLIKEGDYVTFDLELDEGREVVGEVSASGTINAYIMTDENLTALDLDQEFWYEDGSEGVQKATVRFTAPEKGTWLLVVENDSSKDVSANVKINISKASQPTPFLKTEGLELPDQKLGGQL